MTELSTAAKALHQLPVQQLKGVGAKLAQKLAALNIHSVQDVLFHLPLRYQDRTHISAIGALRPGVDAVVEGVVQASGVAFGRRRSLACKIQDGTGTITLRFYHFSAAQKQQLEKGAHIRGYGEPRRGNAGLEFYHPEYKLINDDSPAPMETSLTAIYPSTEGLAQGMWRKLTDQALLLLARHPVQELLPFQLPLPESELNGGLQGSADLASALQFLHRPPPGVDLSAIAEGEHPYQRRLAFEELLAHNLAMQQLRHELHTLGSLPLKKVGSGTTLEKQFLSGLPYALTGAQKKVFKEIAQDLARTVPMMRLVQGDVGCGKTTVAALAVLRAVANGVQVAIMAPTEILAEQHLANFSGWFEPLGVSIAWLAGKVKGKARTAALQRIASGEAAVVIGTHALFQEEVEFARLGLVIIDEQHRFGVHQRLALSQKSQATVGAAHQLVMTATPIPRTLAMTAYADLDTSIIDELPPGRTPVNTLVVSNERREEIVERVNLVCLKGQQAYWVCTLIDESELLRAEAAEATYQLLKEALPELPIGLVHGRLKPAEKAEIMADFKAGKFSLLVATTVIEVGVDVPNASLMIIENAERLGLAQLHQLRGRVGRGSLASHCVLLYQSPLGYISKERLLALRESNDGFYIAEKDLEIRGPGEVLGTRQTGLMQLKMADIQRDADLLPLVAELSEQYSANYAELAPLLIERWLADKTIYAAA